MKLSTFNYKKDSGWSIAAFPEMDSEQTLVLAFCAPEFINDPKPIQDLILAYPKSKITGCSSAGEIFGQNIYDHSISVAVIQFEATHIKLIACNLLELEGSFQVGKKITAELLQENLKNIFLLSDGLNVNGSELIDGVNSALPSDKILVTGGLAGDGSNFKKTWVIYQGALLSNTIIGIGFYGSKIKIGHGSQGGWDSFGPERRITRSKENVLYEIDNVPALDLYKEYLGDRAAGLPATGLLFPLMVRKDLDDTTQIVRTILSVGEADKSITFAGNVPQGYLARLMKANFDRLITGANEAALSSKDKVIGNGKILVIDVSCVGRRLLLGERTEEETEATLAIFPEGTQQIGFYSYGELSPYASGKCDLHNQTMTITTIAEEE